MKGRTARTPANRGDKAIPSTIHFIWMGKPIPKPYLETLYSIAAVAKKSGFNVQLWVDKPSTFYHTAAREDIFPPSLEVKSVEEIITLVKKSDLFDDIEDEKEKKQAFRILESYIRREMTGLTNFAAASDILRYIILYCLGGYYFDMDTQFLISGTSKLRPDSTKHGVLLPFSTDSLKDKSKKDSISNDILGAIPHHDLFKMRLRHLIKTYVNYDTPPDSPVMAKKTFSSQAFFSPTLMDKKREPQVLSSSLGGYEEERKIGKKNRLMLTLQSTGPVSLHEDVKKYMKKASITDPNELMFTRLPSNSDLVRVAGLPAMSVSDANWLSKTHEGNIKKDFEKIFGHFKELYKQTADDFGEAKSNWKKEIRVIDEKSKEKITFYDTKDNLDVKTLSKKMSKMRIEKTLEEKIQVKYLNEMDVMFLILMNVLLADFEMKKKSMNFGFTVEKGKGISTPFQTYCRYLTDNADSNPFVWKCYMLLNYIYQTMCTYQATPEDIEKNPTHYDFINTHLSYESQHPSLPKRPSFEMPDPHRHTRK